MEPVPQRGDGRGQRCEPDARNEKETNVDVDVLREPLQAPCAWTGAVMRRTAEWRYQLTLDEVAELEEARDCARRSGLPPEQVGVEAFPLPRLGEIARGWADELENGRGFLLIKGLPVERYTEEDAALIFGGIGRHMGIPVSQNASGDFIGHVRDTGRSIRDPSVRGYQTTVRLPYHTDGSDVVGLLCLKPALSGGVSTIVSSTTVYNEIVRRRPDLVDVLYEPFYFDRREEQGPGESPWYVTRLVCYRGGKLSMRYIRGFIESAQRFADVPRLSARQVELLDLIDSVATDTENYLDMDFEPGDMQFVSNYTVMHSRTHYEDHPEPALKRHLLRLWLTLPEGRELDADFGRGMSAAGAAGQGRGGVTPRVPA